MAMKAQPKYVIDEEGKPVSVLPDIRSYRAMMRQVEELEAIRAYDAAKADPGEILPFEQAVREIRNSRR